MPLKFKIVFYNLMLFLVLFDFIYLMVWIFSIEMNPVKAIVVAGITAVLMPWARKSKSKSGRKVIIRSLGYDFYKKQKKQRINKQTITKE
jgi:hypothetical protein